MADNITTDTTNSDVTTQANDKEVSTGSDSNTQKVETKTLTQEEFDKKLKERLAENTNKVKRDLEKHYEGKVVLTQEELEKKLKEYADSAIETHKRDTLIATKRNEFKARGLSDEQLDIIAEKTDKPEEFDKVAERYFGALLKKDAPIINPGNNSKNESTADVDDLIGKALEAARNR